MKGGFIEITVGELLAIIAFGIIIGVIAFVGYASETRDAELKKLITETCHPIERGLSNEERNAERSP